MAVRDVNDSSQTLHSASDGGVDNSFAADASDRHAEAVELDAVPVPGDAAMRSGLTQTLAISAKIAVVIGAVELLKLGLFAILPSHTEGIAEAAIHTVLLVVVAMPLFLLWGIRPYVAARNAAYAQLADVNARLRREIGERALVEKALRAHEYELELQIGEVGYMKSLMEKQAADAVAIAEDLAFQKQAVEASERRNEYLANHDTLTGLPNRRAFEQELAQMIALARTRNGSVTLMFVDLDNFKAVNDTLGHQRGDDLLVQVAGQLRRSTRESDVIARLGGDEFAVVSTVFGHARDTELRNVAERIREALSIPIEAEDRTVPVTATLGIATWPADAIDPRKLVQCADRAMYAAKNRGRNCVVFFDELQALSAAS
jgi:diguanylate cyclase (GGDEF)-like protein